jgi:probable phosphoglycerate mutase
MRHGKSEANKQGIIVSHYTNGLENYGLTREGEEQIRLSLKKQSVMDSSTIIISSDFLRARETAELAARELGTRPPRTTHLLRERYFGRYELREELYYKMVWQLDEENDRNKDYGVESPEEVQERIRLLIRQMEEEYRNGKILLISHGDPLQITQTLMEGLPAGLHRSMEHLETGEIRELIPKLQED